ncbi:MAG TPA: hypothetical protein VN969_38850 [Streptosporangiaceae bacterium]|nr:hypothetical protein [Streptosporangiaceae bacterium]
MSIVVDESVRLSHVTIFCQVPGDDQDRVDPTQSPVLVAVRALVRTPALAAVLIALRVLVRAPSSSWSGCVSWCAPASSFWRVCVPGRAPGGAGRHGR